MPEREAGPGARSPVRALRDGVWTPLATTLLVLAPGLVSLATGRPVLFPSLAPTALMQAHDPDHPSSRVYNVVVSHLLGLGSAFLVVTLLGIAHEKSVFEVGHLSGVRLAAAVLAVAIAAALEMLLRASHPPAAATTLLAALGSFHPTVRDTVNVAIGVAVVAVVGEALRRLRAHGG
jgi:hypothetical protein